MEDILEKSDLVAMSLNILGKYIWFVFLLLVFRQNPNLCFFYLQLHKFASNATHSLKF